MSPSSASKSVPPVSPTSLPTSPAAPQHTPPNTPATPAPVDGGDQFGVPHSEFFNERNSLSPFSPPRSLGMQQSPISMEAPAPASLTSPTEKMSMAAHYARMHTTSSSPLPIPGGFWHTSYLGKNPNSGTPSSASPSDAAQTGLTPKTPVVPISGSPTNSSSSPSPLTPPSQPKATTTPQSGNWFSQAYAGSLPTIYKLPPIEKTPYWAPGTALQGAEKKGG